MLPRALLYVPAAHITHVPPSGPYDPALQIQSVFSPLPAGESDRTGHAWHVLSVAPDSVEYSPGLQLVHGVVPASILYVPGTQTSHLPPSGPLVPALHVHNSMSYLPSLLFEFAGHNWQISDVAPMLFEYFPSTQNVHAEGPMIVLYVPESQRLQGIPSAPVAPVLHVQSVISLLPVGEFELVGQLSHISDSAPIWTEYFPS